MNSSTFIPVFQQQVIDFDPNDLGDVWGTYVPARRPAWKIARTRASALASTNEWATSALFRHVGGKWVRVLTKAAALKGGICDHCGAATAVPKTHYDFRRNLQVTSGYRDSATWKWVRLNGKVVDPPELEYLCERCFLV